MTRTLSLHLFCVALAIVSSLTGARTQLCRGNDSLPYLYQYHINSQDQLDFLAQNCTEIDATIYIDGNYSGGFILHNVTNITASLSMAHYGGVTPPGYIAPSIEFPDLISALDLSFYDIPALRKLSLPKLERVKTLSLMTTGETPGRLEFPVLHNASRILLRGNLQGVSFPSLKNVSDDLTICNTINCEIMEDTNTTMDIALPVLETANNVRISGRASSLAAPELATLAPTRETNSPSIAIGLKGNAVPISLPKLTTLGSRSSFQGNFSSLSLHSLVNTSWLSIRSESNLDINLPVENAGGWSSFSGPIRNISFPNLRDFDEILVDTSLEFDCEAFQEGLENQVNGTIPINRTYTWGRRVTCQSDAAMVKTIGSGIVGIVAPVVALLSWV
ncbi:hypothetical protein BJY04DRAFT_178571 [Aspergillus karnatakaensis]|uniref:uncharacterized protein n=1 Tax=Aspergillus karnatakaensis TaxID=1810916 RepID=UPI003CCCC936